MMSTGSAVVNEDTASLRAAQRRLWADHVAWTRQYIVAALAGAPDAQAAAGRLLANQEDIGHAIVPFYGEEAGAELTRLLKDHILIAVDAIDAAIADDERRFRRHDRRWSANAEKIAAFLADANPNWPEEDLQDLLAQHLRLTKHEMLARFEERWEDDVAAFDDILTEILTMSDALSEGIVAQFPDRFGDAGNPSGFPSGRGMPASSEVASLRAAMRKLWAHHVGW